MKEKRTLSMKMIIDRSRVYDRTFYNFEQTREKE